MLFVIADIDLDLFYVCEDECMNIAQYLWWQTNVNINTFYKLTSLD